MTAPVDRLSVLPDDVLLRILSFAPAWEAAASATLSRRWRSLWHRTSAVNLDSRPYAEAERELCRYSTPTCYAFFYHASAVLDAFRGGTGLRRLTLFLERGTYYAEQTEGRRVAKLLDDPAVARLEELSIGCEHNNPREYCYCPPLASLPCAVTLRVLELTHCNLEPRSSTAPTPLLAFPCLTDLTLRRCFLSHGYLQAMVDAAPALATLALENVSQRAPDSQKLFRMSDDVTLPLLRIRCPTVTALLVVATYVRKEELELDMRSLVFFRYRGYPVKLSLTSSAPGLARVELDVTRPQYQQWNSSVKYEPLSRMLSSISSTRALKLRLNYIEDIIDGDEEDDGGVNLPTFPNLGLLDLGGKCGYMNDRKAMVTATLLRSCLAMSELRLRLDMQYDYDDQMDPVEGPFRESVDRFERLASMSSAHRAAVQIGGVSELPDAFTDTCPFSCLRRTLRKVTLRYTAQQINCFPVQLAKFIVENAMVLEEMHVHDGSQFWSDHLCHKVARWRADSFRTRNLPDTADGFRVYHLQLDNPAVDSDKESGYHSD